MQGKKEGERKGKAGDKKEKAYAKVAPKTLGETLLTLPSKPCCKALYHEVVSNTQGGLTILQVCLQQHFTLTTHEFRHVGML